MTINLISTGEEGELSLWEGQGWAFKKKNLKKSRERETELKSYEKEEKSAKLTKGEQGKRGASPQVRTHL